MQQLRRRAMRRIVLGGRQRLNDGMSNDGVKEAGRPILREDVEPDQLRCPGQGLGHVH